MTALTLVAAAAGVVLLAFTLRSAGVGDILTLGRRIGWRGAGLILLFSGLRFLVRALAWRRCVEGPRRLPIGDAFGAVLMGEALGNLTPLATILSEPAKAVFVRHRLPFVASFRALVVENIFYGASIAAVIVAGAVALLLSFRMPPELRAVSLGAAAAMALVLAAAWMLLRTRFGAVSGAIAWAGSRGLRVGALDRRLEKITDFEEHIGGFWNRNRPRLIGLVALEASFHLLGVAEVVTALWLMGPESPSLLVALILESTGRVINVAFRFVPMRVGVDEWGNEWLGRALGLAPATGTTLALVRKGRVLAWTAVGVLLLVARGLTVREVLAEAERVRAAEE